MRETENGYAIYGIMEDWGYYWVVVYKSHGLELSIQVPKTEANSHLNEGDEVELQLLLKI